MITFTNHEQTTFDYNARYPCFQLNITCDSDLNINYKHTTIIPHIPLQIRPKTKAMDRKNRTKTPFSNNAITPLLDIHTIFQKNICKQKYKMVLEVNWRDQCARYSAAGGTCSRRIMMTEPPHRKLTSCNFAVPQHSQIAFSTLL